MPPTIVRGTNDKPVASGQLVTFFEGATDLDGQLFVGCPIIAGADGRHAIDAVYVSPTHGIVVFDLVEGTDLGDYQDRQDDAATKLESRLLIHRELVQRRRLIPPLAPVTYAPALGQSQPSDRDYPVASMANLTAVIAAQKWPESNLELYSRTLSALQNISTIRKVRGGRDISNAQSRGDKLQALENSIATLDNLQGKAVIETVQGVQRIRGPAGSGKTIVLALKACGCREPCRGL